jgi:hypothetical protein
MAKHDVRFELPPRTLGRADAKFQVKRNGRILGTLTVSNGSVVWFPRGTKYGYKMVWPKLDRLMRTEATRIEAR